MKVSICIPTYEMNGNGLYFLERALKSIELQYFNDYEVVVTDDSRDDVIAEYCKQVDGLRYFKNVQRLGMAGNTNKGMDEAQGELVKILYQDDYFYDRWSLHRMVKGMTPSYCWLVTACTHTQDGVRMFNPHLPYYSHSANTLGSPSVTMLRKGINDRFDPKLTWVLDLELYRRLYKKYGKPKILNDINVVIGLHQNQTTNLLTNQEKLKEQQSI